MLGGRRGYQKESKRGAERARPKRGEERRGQVPSLGSLPATTFMGKCAWCMLYVRRGDSLDPTDRQPVAHLVVVVVVLLLSLSLSLSLSCVYRRWQEEGGRARAMSAFVFERERVIPSHQWSCNQVVAMLLLERGRCLYGEEDLKTKASMSAM